MTTKRNQSRPAWSRFVEGGAVAVTSGEDRDIVVKVLRQTDPDDVTSLRPGRGVHTFGQDDAATLAAMLIARMAYDPATDTVDEGDLKERCDYVTEIAGRYLANSGGGRGVG